MRGKRILLVEDSPTYRDLATILLTGDGYVVTVATTAEDGLRLAREDPPDLILMDTHLPGMNGLDAVRRLREDSRTKRVPVIGLTSDSEGAERDRQDARGAGFDDYVVKPIDRPGLRAVVGAILDPPASGS